MLRVFSLARVMNRPATLPVNEVVGVGTLDDWGRVMEVEGLPGRESLLVSIKLLAAGVELLGLGIRVLGDPRVDARPRAGQNGVPRLIQEEPNVAFRLVIVALTEMGIPDQPVLVNQILRGPVLVLVGVPCCHLRINGNRPLNAVMRDRLPDVGDALLKLKLGAVHPNDDEPAVLVLVPPVPQERERALAVDARVGPEVDEDDLPAKLADLERRAVLPIRYPHEFRRLGAAAGQLARSARRSEACTPVQKRVANTDDQQKGDDRRPSPNRVRSQWCQLSQRLSLLCDCSVKTAERE